MDDAGQRLPTRGLPGHAEQSPGKPGSAVLLGGAAGEIPWAAVGSAGAALDQLAQAGANEVIPAAAAHVLALELVVQAAVLEVDLAGAVVDRRDGERRLGADPVFHEGALGHRPANGRRARRLVDADEERRLIRHHREPQLAIGQARARHRAPPGGERLGRGDGVEHDVSRGVDTDGRAVVGASCHWGLLELEWDIAICWLLPYGNPAVASSD